MSSNLTLTPREMGLLAGKAFYTLRIDLEREGSITPSEWIEFMSHRMATLSMQFHDEEAREEWAQACLDSYRAYTLTEDIINANC